MSLVLRAERIARAYELRPRFVELGRARVEQSLDVFVRLRERLVRMGERVPLGVERAHEPRVRDRDRGLVGEREQELYVGVAEARTTHAMFDVEDAEHAALALDRRRADRHARDRLQHEAMHGHVLGEATVALCVDRHDGLSVDEHGLGDRLTERDVRIVGARGIANRASFELAVRADEQHEAALGAGEVDGALVDAREQTRKIALAREALRDLEQARPAAAVAEVRARVGAIASSTHARSCRRAERYGPEGIARFLRQCGRDLLEDLERGLT